MNQLSIPGTIAGIADSGAVFKCRYRYRLWRFFVERPTRIVNFCCLNGSTAGSTENDPTVDRLITRARMWCFDGMTVTNLFGVMSTDPRKLDSFEDPVGPENDAYILAAAEEATVVICAWGTHGYLHGRGAAVEKMLRAATAADPDKLQYLRLTKGGMPEHPLYIGYSVLPKPWKVDA